MLITRSQVPVGAKGPAAQAHERREAFRRWIKRHRKLVWQRPFLDLLRLYEGEISLSSAYRVAIHENLRGKRRNKSRYSEFWSAVDWRLPDAALSKIWAVSRTTLRQRRVRLGVSEPIFVQSRDQGSREYLRLYRLEWQRSQSFTHARPQ